MRNKCKSLILKCPEGNFIQIIATLVAAYAYSVSLESGSLNSSEQAADIAIGVDVDDFSGGFCGETGHTHDTT
jgi:hypothetical protein